MAKTVIFPENAIRLQAAKLMREIEEQYPNSVGHILLQVGKASKKCGCERMDCPACGLIKLHLRTRRIVNARKPIKHGYLTGGKSL